jgi:alkanesulfonate monooxygenase SsuD/methylene tetrahydromethanopterin reductase-like flavin-dependent oxidoreductase (luciferase family)
VLGALCRISSNIRLGFGVTLSPPELIHPTRLADVATVDLLSRGCVEPGDMAGADRIEAKL